VTERTIKAGQRFLHAHQITRSSSAKNPVPEPCEITRLAGGQVYYRNSSGFRSVTSLEGFSDTVKEWIEPEPQAE
jgi:hypothetical protein